MGKPLEVYQYLEPLYNDYRKIRERKLDGTFGLTHVDEAVHDMLHSDHLFDVALPRIPHRWRWVPHRPGLTLHMNTSHRVA